MRRLNLVLLSLGVVFLTCLLWHVGPGELWKEMCSLGWGLALLILAEGVGNMAHTVAWRHCINAPGERLALGRLFQMAMAGYSINYLTPSASMGGEVTRIALLTSMVKGPEAVSSILLDKLMTAAAHLLLVVLGGLFLFCTVRLPPALWVAMALTTALLTGGIGTFLFLQKQGKLGAFCRWLTEHNLGGRFLQGATEQITKVDGALVRFYREHPRDVLLSLAWHVVGHCAAILQVWLFLWQLDRPAAFSAVLAAAFLGLWTDLLTFAVPMNLGALEGSRILALKTIGLDTLSGMTYGVGIRVAQIFWAVFGLLTYFYTAFTVRRRQRQIAPGIQSG